MQLDRITSPDQLKEEVSYLVYFADTQEWCITWLWENRLDWELNDGPLEVIDLEDQEAYVLPTRLVR